MTFEDWLTGDKVTNIGVEYSIIYWITSIVVLTILILLIIFSFLKSVPNKIKQNLLVGIAIFQLIFEIVWRIIFVIFKGSTFVDIWPAYPCNLGGILVPIICIINSKKGKDLFYLFAFVGACLSFALPGEMYSYDYMTFPILKSALQHTGILFIPAMEYAMGKYRPTIKDYPLLFVGCLIHLLNTEGVDEWLGLDPATNDYMYLRQNYPFEIPGIPSPFVTSIFALIVFAILLIALSPKESIGIIKNKWNELISKFKIAISSKKNS